MALISNNVERIVKHLAKSKTTVSFHKSIAKQVQKEWEARYTGEIEWFGFGSTIHAARTGKVKFKPTPITH